jgi:(E)-4-hydroxy-3-methylbut-2-enyl-diphosphate synthase
MVESAMEFLRIARSLDYHQIILSMKSSNPQVMVQAYRLLIQQMHNEFGEAYPLHLGVTEAGDGEDGRIKSAIGIGTLLAEGIGDTIRVSLTDEPEKEVEVGKEILRSLGLTQRSIEIISCPTCGRLEVDLFKITGEIEERLKGIKKPVKIALLGCVVNGPGEASEADIGIAAGKGVGILYRKGEVVRRVKEEEIIDAVVEEVMNFTPTE